MSQHQPRFSKLLDAVPEYPFAKVNRICARVQERDGIEVINARIGIPDEEAPPTIKRLMAQYVTEERSTFGYPVDVHPSRGIDALVEAIVADYKARYGVTIKAENVAVTGYTKTALHNLARLFDTGCGVVPEPVYPAYEAAIVLAGHKVRRVTTSAASGWLPDLRFTGEDSFFYFCDPNNPTGAVADRGFYEKILVSMEQHGVGGIFDKAYKDYVFESATRPVSITQVPGLMDHGYEVVSLSKHANFVGIGLGWLVSSEANIRRWLRFEGQYGQGVPLYVQKAAVDALSNLAVKAEIAGYMAQVGQRRDLLVSGLNNLGLQCRPPAATPYVWVTVPQGQDDESFVLDKLLGKAHVAFMPGSYFGGSGRGYFRATLFLSEERIQEALKRIAAVRDW